MSFMRKHDSNIHNVKLNLYSGCQRVVFCSEAAIVRGEAASRSPSQLRYEKKIESWDSITKANMIYCNHLPSFLPLTFPSKKSFCCAPYNLLIHFFVEFILIHLVIWKINWNLVKNFFEYLSNPVSPKEYWLGNPKTINLPNHRETKEKKNWNFSPWLCRYLRETRLQLR